MSKQEQLIFDNEFQSIIIHTDIKAFEQRFKSESAELFGQSYIDEMVLFKEVLEEQIVHRNQEFKNLIINVLSGGPTMESSVQDWMHNTLYPLLSKWGITTKAYCMGKEIIAKLSIQMTAEDDPNALFKFRFFSDLQEGKDWLNSLSG